MGEHVYLDNSSGEILTSKHDTTLSPPNGVWQYSGRFPAAFGHIWIVFREYIGW